MNTILTTPDVKLFVAAVREHLADLSEEEREELVGGLDADINDLVEERGLEALPDPGDYARELRAAAGFDPEMRPVRKQREGAVWLTGTLDAAGARWERFASGLPGKPWELLVALRPVWWVLRAWVALQAVDLVWGSGAHNMGLSPVPSLMGWGLPLLVVAVVLSTQLGRGRLWPATPGRGLLARVLLLVLNVLAIALLPVVFGGLLTPTKVETWYGESYNPDPPAGPGLYFEGQPVANIYPYDAQGRPLVGIQLVDRDGRRLPIGESTQSDPMTGDLTFLRPWMNGRTQLLSVFPLPETRPGPDAEVSGEETTDLPEDAAAAATLQAPPFASLPPVTLTGVRPSTLVSAPTAAQPDPKGATTVVPGARKQQPRR